MKKPVRKQTSLMFREDFHTALKDLAWYKRKTLSDVYEEAIEEYLRKNSEDVKKAEELSNA